MGVEAPCRAAGVSKRSMYQLFTSKDEVLAASLERAAPTYWETVSVASTDWLSTIAEAAVGVFPAARWILRQSWSRLRFSLGAARRACRRAWTSSRCRRGIRPSLMPVKVRAPLQAVHRW